MYDIYHQFKKKNGTEHEFPSLHSMLQPLFITITPPIILRKKSYFMSAISPFFSIRTMVEKYELNICTMIEFFLPLL